VNIVYPVKFTHEIGLNLNGKLKNYVLGRVTYFLFEFLWTGA